MIPAFFSSRLERAFREQLYGGEGGQGFDFMEPRGEPALTDTESVSWRVFENPVSLLIGGIAAVLLELAEPRVRSGVWDHTTFRTDPMKRMRRTGLAAMVTVYGAGDDARRMIAGVRRMHEKVRGRTPAGIDYAASDPELLRWVHATAAFGFLQAYHRFVKPVSPAERDLFYLEGAPIARLYGAEDAPESEAALQELFAAMQPQLERSEIIFEFLEIMRKLPLLPRPLKFLNGLFVRAAIDLLPEEVRGVLGLEDWRRVSSGGVRMLRLLAGQVDRLELKSTPAAQARMRLSMVGKGPAGD